MKKALFGLLFAVLSLGGAFIAHQSFAAEQIDNTPDCDTVAIVRCGSMTESAVRANYLKGDVARVYGAFGIRQSALSGSFVSGVVWSDGRVTVGNTTVATGAVTAGRWYHPTSDMKFISGTDRAYVMSTSHFVTPGQTAWLKFDENGKFIFAIIKSCGNPVTAKPIVPNFVCTGLTATPINRTTFRFAAKAYGLHATITGYTYNFGDGTILNTPAPGPSHTYAKPGTYTATLSVTFKLQTNGAVKTVTAPVCQVKVPVSPPPVTPTYSCDELTKNQIARDQYGFAAKASAANGAAISKYAFDYGDGTSSTVATSAKTATANHTYAKAGTYTARVTVSVVASGKTVPVTSNACTTKVTVEEKPVPPSYSCDALTQNKISRTEAKFNASASAANGATISKYTFDFGDGKTADATTSANTATINHTYDQPGTYTAKVSVTVKVGTETKVVDGPKCTVNVTVEAAPSYSCDELTKNQITRTNYGFTAKASAANGATITGYTFDYGDGKTETKTTPTTTHEFAQAGDYTIKVTANVSVDGQTKPVTSDNCVVKVSIQEEQTPIYECKSLTAVLIGKKEDRTFQYSLSYNADGGATLKNVDFDFGDQSDVKTFTPAQLNNVTHAYAKDGEYTTTATLHFNVNDTVQDKKCEVKVNPSNPECKPGIPVGDERCKPEECKPGVPAGDQRCEECKPGIPMGDTRCEEGHVLPATIASTGPEAVLSGLFGTGALSYGTYSYLASRRALKNAMKR